MSKYHKIQSIYKRDADNKNRFIVGAWSTPELDMLKDITWEFTEKVDGTNIRIMFDGQTVEYGGRTDAAQIPAHLVKALVEMFTVESLRQAFSGIEGSITMYGEGYGHKIQKGGKYLSDEKVSFALFDIKAGDWWLKREDVNEVAEKLGIVSVPVLGEGTLNDAINIVKKGLVSRWGDFEAEGIVARPKVDLFSRNGGRIIAKIKARDFNHH